MRRHIKKMVWRRNIRNAASVAAGKGIPICHQCSVVFFYYLMLILHVENYQRLCDICMPV